MPRFFQSIVLEDVVADDSALLNAKLRLWEHSYNFDRPRTFLDG